MIRPSRSSLYPDVPTAPNIRSELLKHRYLMKDPTGRVIETPRQMFWRVARAVAAAEAGYGVSRSQIESLAEKSYRLMIRGRFLPNSPTLMNAGRRDGLLSACFVLPVDDSIDRIFDAVKHTALIQKAGGGTGFAFDTLRPTGDLVASSGGTTSGPISFWRVFAQTTEAIQQGAHRRGANMGMMSIEHPDILAFIHAKQDPAAFRNFNISVKVPDSFMEALRQTPDASHVVVNPRTSERYVIPRNVNPGHYALQDLRPADEPGGACYSRRDVWNLIVSHAHASGEPGVCFIDRVNQSNPTPALGRMAATNPCGEQPLLPYEACNLGSIDVARFVDRQPKAMAWDRLRRTIRLGVRFLDDVIDANHYPVPQIGAVTRANRKIGLGLMGFADALILLGIRYDSQEALSFAGQLTAFCQQQAHAASQELAAVRGNFPNWAGSTWNTVHHRPMRNATCTTIAPTGSISILAGCSSGIEPLYGLACRRRILDGREFIHVHPLLEHLGRKGGWLNDRVRQALLEGVPPEQIPGLPACLAGVLVTAHQVSPEMHVRVQAAFQKHTDNAVSKTVNLPADASVADVDRVFRLVFELGCKGITVYRDGSRQGQTFSKARDAVGLATPARAVPRTRVRVAEGKTTKFHMGCGTLFVTVNRDEQGLCEVFANLGKAGGCPAQSEATCRAISAALRSGVDARELIEQLRAIRCLSAVAARNNGKQVNVQSCPDAIAKAMQEALVQPSETETVETAAGRLCPFCRSPLRREAGCFVCDRCCESSCG